MRKEALAFPPEESTLFFINSHLIITYDKQYFVTLRVKYLISNSMSESKRIKTALVSVYHKEGLDEIITKPFLSIPTIFASCHSTDEK